MSLHSLLEVPGYQERGTDPDARPVPVVNDIFTRAIAALAVRRSPYDREGVSNLSDWQLRTAPRRDAGLIAMLADLFRVRDQEVTAGGSVIVRLNLCQPEAAVAPNVKLSYWRTYSDAPTALFSVTTNVEMGELNVFCHDAAGVVGEGNMVDTVLADAILDDIATLHTKGIISRWWNQATR